MGDGETLKSNKETLIGDREAVNCDGEVLNGDSEWLNDNGDRGNMCTILLYCIVTFDFLLINNLQIP